MIQVKQEFTFVCPRGRRVKRTVTGAGRKTIRCTCGCGSSYTVQVR